MALFLDIKMTEDSTGLFDFDIENGKIVTDDGFDTAIYTSLFTDQRAPNTSVNKVENARGWAGDIYNEYNRKIGSLLWLLEQRKTTQATLNEAIDYVEKSLEWMIEDDVCSSISVAGSIVSGAQFEINIDASITSDETSISKRNITIWLKTGV